MTIMKKPTIILCRRITVLVVLLFCMAGVVSAAQPDLVVTAINPNVGVGAYMFANEPNIISVTVKNSGDAAAGASTLSVNVAGTPYTSAVGTLAVGASSTVTVTDTLSRNGGASVTINANADSTGIVSESNEGNNVLTSIQTVYNNGYKGKRFNRWF